nr:toxin-antitoxin system YwqK family antitoxin [uncultured Allomuricauda sp.]
MKLFFWSLLSLGIILIGCSERKEKPTPSTAVDSVFMIPDTLVEKSVLTYNRKISLWTLNSLPYSGFAVSYYPDNSLKEKFGILNGKKQDKHIRWYPDGHFKSVADYHKGKLHGEKKIWSSDSIHVLIAHYNYHTGKPHGKQTKWYTTGELFKKMNLNRGKEEGLQQAFRKNGALFANYEAREGRIFGMKKAKLCYSLEDENVQYKK